MDVLTLVIFTLVAWLVHLFLVGRYLRYFPNTKSREFRVVHVAEIGLVIMAMLALYFHAFDSDLSRAATAVVVLGTLVIVDILLFSASKRARRQFDWGHFAAAYGIIILLTLIYSELF